MAGVSKLETDVHLNATAEQFHDMFCSKPHHISNFCGKIKSAHMHEGEWGKEGSIIVWNYIHEGKHCVAKELIEKVDKDNNTITFKVLEGDLMEHFKSFKVTIHCIPQEKGSKAHWTLEYEKLHNEVVDPHTIIDLAKEMSSDIDAYLSQSEA